MTNTQNSLYNLISNEPIFFNKNSDFLFYSFYTNDEYYEKNSEILSKNLKNLKIPHQIDKLIIKKGTLTWTEICRKKIVFINQICLKYPEKKIFWLDIDCNLVQIPNFVTNFSADIIGFYRSFETPLNMGYFKKSRFWEPCFLGFNKTSQARDFIAFAAELEERYTGQATDDYFFEEAWRIKCPYLSFQIIPSVEKFSEEHKKGFFITGSSGNVSEFVTKVATHTPIHESNLGKIRRVLRSIKRHTRSYFSKNLNT